MSLQIVIGSIKIQERDQIQNYINTLVNLVIVFAMVPVSLFGIATFLVRYTIGTRH